MKIGDKNLNEFETVIVSLAPVFKLIKKTAQSFLVEVRVQAKPLSKKEFCKINSLTHCLIVGVNAPAVEGKANAKILEVLSKTLGIAKNKIEIDKGEKSKIKKVLIQFDLKNQKDSDEICLKLTSILKD